MGSEETRGAVVHGTKATVGDTYAVVLAAAAGNREYYNASVSVATHPVLVSFDGGTTDHLFVPTTAPVQVYDIDIPGAIHVKNATGASAGTAFHISVW